MSYSMIAISGKMSTQFCIICSFRSLYIDIKLVNIDKTELFYMKDLLEYLHFSEVLCILKTLKIQIGKGIK